MKKKEENITVIELMEYLSELPPLSTVSIGKLVPTDEVLEEDPIVSYTVRENSVILLGKSEKDQLDAFLKQAKKKGN